MALACMIAVESIEKLTLINSSNLVSIFHFVKIGSSGWIRTSNHSVNSRMLYH